MSEYATFELWQGGQIVASVSGPRKAALTEMAHCAMVYGQDGPVEIRETTGEHNDGQE